MTRNTRRIYRATARYDWTPRGELAAVYDRSGTRRCATYLTMINTGAMVAHRYAGRPEMRYRYDDIGRVTEQRNPAGFKLHLSRGMRKNRISITDSLNGVRCCIQKAKPG